MKDTKARIAAFAAIMLSCGAYTIGYASADSISEPDAYAVKTQVQELQEQIDFLTQQETVDANALSERVGVLEDDDVSNCLAYSDFHYYKERAGKHGRKWRFPVMLWNMSNPTCRPTAEEWHPARRILTNVR